jgi:hypothetical protein
MGLIKFKADRPGSYKAGKLEGLKARKLPGFLAFWLPSFIASDLLASRYRHFLGRRFSQIDADYYFYNLAYNHENTPVKQLKV